MECKYKKSIYNHFVKIDDNYSIAFNAMTTGLCEVDLRFFTILNNIENVDEKELNRSDLELFKGMKKQGFIIEDYLDELELLEFSFLKNRTSNNSLSLTIAPTMNCNFKCDYCFEERTKQVISEEVKDKIYDLVEDSAKSGMAIIITWFGGEPLLSFNTIEEMSLRMMEVCNKYGVEYGAAMVSNGYLFSDAIIERYKKLKISSVQVTIDGIKEIHDARRVLHNGKGTFDKIVNNIQKLKDNDLSVNIRVNVDKTNNDNVYKLIDFLNANMADIPVSFGHIKVYNKACKSLTGNCYSNEEFSNLYRKYNNELSTNIISRFLYPKVKPIFCGANNLNSLVVDPIGNTYKCWNDIGFSHRSTGNLLTDSTSENKFIYLKYVLHNPLNSDECRKCDILPICMGGCVYDSIENGIKNCEKWKYNLEDYILDAYEKIQR